MELPGELSVELLEFPRFLICDFCNFLAFLFLQFDLPGYFQ
jgi:hypothetical protein